MIIFRYIFNSIRFAFECAILFDYSLDYLLSFTSLMHHDTRPSPLVRCNLGNGKIDDVDASKEPDHRSDARLRIDPKVLVIVETTYSRLGRDIAELLVYNRIKYISLNKLFFPFKYTHVTNAHCSFFLVSVHFIQIQSGSGGKKLTSVNKLR